MKIALCSSASFYKHLKEIGQQLEDAGYQLFYPKTSAMGALQLKNDGSKAYREWHRNLIDTHFRKIEKSNAVLVVNDSKHGINGYIGANVMMEITIAYYLGKPVYVLNKVEQDNPVYDEICAIEAIILDGDLSKIGQNTSS